MSPTPANDLFDHFRIDLDAGKSPLFRGGERLTGNVKIQLKKEVVIQAIRIQFKGRAIQKDSKKSRDVEKIIFDKDYMLLERPPGKEDPGNFTWKADFEYSLPFQYVLPLGCPSSFEGPDGFVRYFTRVTLETTESKGVYLAKKHFSIYDLETVPAIDPRYQEPYTYRHTFKSGGCCCKRQVYMEFIMPKRVFYAGENIEGRMIIDNINDERIANDIQYNVVERTVKPELSEEEALKHPARVIKSARIDGSNVEKRKNQIIIGSILIPASAPVSLPNAVALAALPKDRTSPQLSPDDQASKLFEHESIISQSRKEPVFRLHYALQLLIGKFIVEVPFVLRPIDSEEVRNLLKAKQTATENIQLTTSQVALKDNKSSADQFVEPDEHDKIIVDEAPVVFYPTVPVYIVRPAEEPAQWPPLGTFENDKLVWHPDKKPVKLTKQQKADQKRLANEAKAEKKRQLAEEKKNAKAQKRPKKELVVVTEEVKPEESKALVVNVETTTVDNQLTPIPSQVEVSEAAATSKTDQQQPETSVNELIDAEVSVQDKPQKKTKAELKAEKQEAKRRKEEEKLAAKQLKEQEKQTSCRCEETSCRSEERQAAEAKKGKKLQTKKLKRKAAKEAKKAEEKAAKEAKKHKKDVKSAESAAEGTAEVAGTSTDPHITSTAITETIVVEQHGDAEPTISVTRTTIEEKDGQVTTITETSDDPEVLAHAVAELNNVPFEPQPITEEFVTVSNGHHHEENNLNGHHDEAVHENGTNGKIDGEVESNGHVESDAASLKKKNAEASSNEPLPTEA
ncbi:Arrestin-C domain-containing protein [Aphelenchoides bicaudatus]|nr:Arrestin-C domain-containing protein [Aphelenchoides bicaudatus]